MATLYCNLHILSNFFGQQKLLFFAFEMIVIYFGMDNQIFPDDCKFVGIGGEQNALNMAIKRSAAWKRKVSFMRLDLENDATLIPAADLTLAFNIFPYIKSLDYFINILASRILRGTLAIRQYNGASIRFGPMQTSER